MRGRKPKPTPLKILHGSREPINESEPRPTRAQPNPPTHLSKAAKLIWKSIAPVVDGMGLLTDADTEGLGHYCELVVMRRRLTKAIATKGELVKETVLTSDGTPVKKLKANPAMSQLRAVERECRQLAGLFGLDPTSRTRIKVDASRRDAFEDYLNESAAS